MGELRRGPAQQVVPPPVNVLTGWGHSYVVGTGAPANGGFLAVLGRMLKAATISNQGVGGAVLGNPEGGAGAGGVGKVHQVWSPGRTAAPYMTPLAPGVVAGYPLHVVLYGINDVGTFDLPEAFRHNLRAALMRLCQARAFEEGDGAITYGPTGLGTDWQTTALAYALMNSGANVRGLIQSGQGPWVQWAVPADFEGGTVSMSFVYSGGADASIAFTVDGQPAATLALSNANSHYTAKNALVCQRLSIPAAGAHTVRATVTGGLTNNLYFDHAAIAASNPPVILVPTIFRLPAYTGLGYAVAPTDARIDTLNQVIRDVVAEFADRRIAVADEAERALLGTGMLAADGLHPSERGHRALAAALYRKVAGVMTIDDFAFTV